MGWTTPCQSAPAESGAIHCAWLRWQAPVPSFPTGRDALLGALSDWMAAEKRTREASVATESAARPYLKRLEGWTRRLSSVPRLTKPVRKDAEDAGGDALSRLEWVLQRFRAEIRKPPPTDRMDVAAACAVRASREMSSPPIARVIGVVGMCD